MYCLRKSFSPKELGYFASQILGFVHMAAGQRHQLMGDKLAHGKQNLFQSKGHVCLFKENEEEKKNEIINICERSGNKHFLASSGGGVFFSFSKSLFYFMLLSVEARKRM
jgi:hypothetical protein